ncbi:hypothetical protein [Teichococcus coralli]|uniref:hypothetical protein n=1 Tax=Teichococcus coralli TaxID=2545983 RepID=UPI00136DCA8A|nr:hypothetical protein [Pseudoroseomonas coralli]
MDQPTSRHAAEMLRQALNRSEERIRGQRKRGGSDRGAAEVMHRDAEDQPATEQG